MKINPSSSTGPASGGISNENGKRNLPSQYETAHKLGTLYIESANAKFPPITPEFGADRRNLGKEERNLARLATLYGQHDARSVKLDGNRCDKLSS